jgi:DNA mismatch endonuclease (patch repair protein)
MMRAVATRDTDIERFVRRALHANRFRFSLQRKDLPGKPDIVLAKYHTIVFVHGCFWHGHDCRRGVAPKTNRRFWTEKIERNRARDKRAIAALRRAGWSVFVVWGCRVEAGAKRLLTKLRRQRGDAGRWL